MASVSFSSMLSNDFGTVTGARDDDLAILDPTAKTIINNIQQCSNRARVSKRSTTKRRLRRSLKKNFADLAQVGLTDGTIDLTVIGCGFRLGFLWKQ